MKFSGSMEKKSLQCKFLDISGWAIMNLADPFWGKTSIPRIKDILVPYGYSKMNFIHFQSALEFIYVRGFHVCFH